MTPRICVTLTEHGEIAAICADAPVDVFIVDPTVPHDRVYQYGAEIGPQHVRDAIGGYAIGHSADGTLGEGDGTSRRPPIRPRLAAVSAADQKLAPEGDAAIDYSVHVLEVWARSGSQAACFTSVGDAVAHYAASGLEPDRAMMWVEDRATGHAMLVNCTSDLQWRAAQATKPSPPA